MDICVIGAGALGASFGARLAAAGNEMTLVDSWAEHVAAINANGLDADGVPSPVKVRLKAFTPDQAPTGFSMVFLATDTNNTPEAAATAARVLRPDGFALTVQNGIGNLEQLEAALGRSRVVGGSTMCSFRSEGPGRVVQTNLGATTVGELDGSTSPRVQMMAEMLRRAGYEVVVTDDIMKVIWTKFVVNCSINPLAATTGLRGGEIARLEVMDQFQDKILDEIFAVLRAKRLDVGEAALRAKIKGSCRLKYNAPSMLQHVEAGRRTEISALNAALLREAAALGVACPYNEALVALLTGRERASMRQKAEPVVDWAAREAAAEREAKAA